MTFKILFAPLALAVSLAICSPLFTHNRLLTENGQKAKGNSTPNAPVTIAPASCMEWWTTKAPIKSWPPPTGQDGKCKVVGGSDLCNRAQNNGFGAHAGTLDIGFVKGDVKVKAPLTVRFRLRNFGSGDAVNYWFGRVDWGDNKPQDDLSAAFNQVVIITHYYDTAGDFVIHADAGAQFKYQAGGASGSYEACQDNSAPVHVVL